MSGEKKEKLENKVRRFLAEDKYKKNDHHSRVCWNCADFPFQFF